MTTRLGAGCTPAWWVCAVAATSALAGSTWQGCSSGRSSDPCATNPCALIADNTICRAEGDAVFCDCVPGMVPVARGGCVNPGQWKTSPLGGLGVETDDTATFTARLRVVDDGRQPIAYARVYLNEHYYPVDAQGVARIADLPAIDPAVLAIEASGFMPAVRLALPGTAVTRDLAVQLVPFKERQVFDSEAPVTLPGHVAQIMLPPSALVDVEGQRARGQARAQVADLVPGAYGPQAWPGDRLARDERGMPTLVRRWFGALHVRFDDERRRPLSLGLGSSARVKFALPMDAEVQDGQVLGLWSLMTSTGQWSRTSECVVATVQIAGAAQRVCDGAVPHFESTWAVGLEEDVSTPASLGCLQIALDVQIPAGHIANTRLLEILACDGPRCRPSEPWYRGHHHYQRGGDGRRPALCGLIDPTVSHRMVVALDVRGMGEGSGLDGTYLHTTDPIVWTPSQAWTGADVLRSQFREPTVACQQRCEQVVVSIDVAALAGTATYEDADKDGFFVPVEREGSGWLPDMDCDDSDANVHPLAHEPICGGQDTDCDGVASPGNVGWRDVPDPFTWNMQCGSTCARPAAGETSGNLYDEDCDGRVEDADGDGYATHQQPQDCDDLAPTAHPGAREVVGNRIDENCDGVALDYDGDGYFAWGHEDLALDLGFDAQLDPHRFGDCNDKQADVHPGVDVTEEVGQLAFTYRDDSGTSVRTEMFCEFADENGKLSAMSEYALRDRNCDGRVTDLDGDGWARPGDDALGPDRAFDCDDLDPRVYPADTPDPDEEHGPMCVEPSSRARMADADCASLVAPALARCPPLRVEGQYAATTCWEVPNDQMLDLAFCIYPGWETGNPLKWQPGQLWGPCDGGHRLPNCPLGSFCGGELSYSAPVIDHLMQQHTGGQALAFQGMCFPLCSMPRSIP